MTTYSAHEDSVRESGVKDQVKDEGPITVQVEDVPSLTPSLYRPDVDTSAVDPVKLKRKIDFRLLPWLTLLYLMNYLDRGSIGNARLYNMQRSLHITDKQYLVALTAFFFPYALLEVPSNLALKYLRPPRWLPFIVFVWGIAMTCHGFAHNYGDLIGLRCLLGLAEAGLYPGIVFYLSCWYKRSELGSRIAVFFSAATIAGAFSGLLAAAIHNMDGIGGRPGWAWIFILEGLFTILVACASPWVLQDFPESARFLTEAERVYIIRDLKEDMRFSADEEKFELKYLWQCLTDWKTYVTFGIYMGGGGPVFAFSLFTPTIINELGFKATAANLLSVPVYAWACLITFAIATLGDRLGHRGYRGYINLALFGLAFVAYTILIVSRSAALSYFAIYLAASSLYPIIPNNSAWVASNLEGSYKRGAGLAMAISFGNLNGAVTANVYRERDKPWYSLGHGIVLTYIAIGWLSSLTYTLLLRQENKARDRGERDEVIGGIENKSAKLHNGQYSSVADARKEKGDAWSGFRYTV
ncbi:MFS general substrate transporter [Russula ochroleuca]|uniref:MFS general substrate transporter n=1 Tax=Russula ochroleuca TaxID=152965 RepID=A0A9P5TA49_9AGAM|nr:MFS general substrate transporter [Russula ochroleuca]